MVATWKFDGKEVRIKTEKNEWFCGRDVILGFKNINCTLLEQVKKRTNAISNHWKRGIIPPPPTTPTTRAEQCTTLVDICLLPKIKL